MNTRSLLSLSLLLSNAWVLLAARKKSKLSRDLHRTSGKQRVFLAGAEPIADKNDYWRPNYLKHERCTAVDSSDSCQECVYGNGKEFADCFSATKDDTKDVMLEVFDPKWTTFKTEFELKCPKAEELMKYQIKIDSKYDDSWKLYLNGVSQTDPKGDNTYSIDLSAMPKNESIVIQIEFNTPVDLFAKLAEKSGKIVEAGKLKIKGEGDVGEYLQCEDNHVCLSKLAGSPEARRLRNVNRLQLACLEHDLPSEEEGLQGVCTTWRECLQASNMESGIKTLLKAGLIGQSLVYGWRARKDSHGCIDPKFSDPEGWACNCLEDWKKKCVDHRYGTDEEVDENCYTAAFCHSHLVCDSWKDGACTTKEVQDIVKIFDAGSLLETQVKDAASANVLARRAADSASKDFVDSLDQSTGSKACI